MATQLQLLGHSVALLAILDAVSPILSKKLIGVDVDDAALMADFASFIEYTFSLNLEVSKDTLASLSVEEQLHYLKERCHISSRLMLLSWNKVHLVCLNVLLYALCKASIMMRKKLQYLQRSVICLVLTLIFALSSLRPAFALQPYPVTMSMQSNHLCFIQFSVPFIDLFKAAVAETGAAAVGVAAVTKEAVAVTEGIPAFADMLSGTNVAAEVGEGIATVSKAVAIAGKTTSFVVPQIESSIALLEDKVAEPTSTVLEKDSSIKLDKYEPGTGFSGVYNFSTKKLKKNFYSIKNVQKNCILLYCPLDKKDKCTPLSS